MKEPEVPISSRKGKRKAAAEELDDDENDEAAMDVVMSIPGEPSAAGSETTSQFVPLPASDGIQALRDKLHARMSALRRGGSRYHGTTDGEAGSRDELLEERRRQRAVMRERRRKETKEKIRRETEERGKKGKEKERDKGQQTKVRSYSSCDSL